MPDFAPLAADGFAGMAVGQVRRATFVIADREHGTPARVSTAPFGAAVDGVAARDAADGDRVEVIAGGGLAVRVVAGEWLDAGDLVQVGPGGKAIRHRDGAVVGRCTAPGAPGGEVEVAR
jgi:hypothetical protein